jgi:hypothetical protein
VRKAFQAVFSSATFTSRNFEAGTSRVTTWPMPIITYQLTHRGPFRRKRFPEALLLLQLLNLGQIFRLIVLEKDSQQNGISSLRAREYEKQSYDNQEERPFHPGVILCALRNHKRISTYAAAADSFVSEPKSVRICNQIGMLRSSHWRRFGIIDEKS